MSTSRPPKKPATAPVDGAAEQGDREQREQKHVGGTARNVEGRDERHLQERGHEDDCGEGEVVVHYGSSGSGRRRDEDEHRVERREVDVRDDEHLQIEVGVELADERDVADRDPLRVARGELARTRTRR